MHKRRFFFSFTLFVAVVIQTLCLQYTLLAQAEPTHKLITIIHKRLLSTVARHTYLNQAGHVFLFGR